MLRPRIIPLLLAVLFLAPGCGERAVASVPELEQSIVVTRDRVDLALARITRAQSKVELLDRMDGAADTIDAAVSDLERIGAPSGYENDVDRLVESVHQLAFDVQATADQIREPGFGDLLVGTRGLSFESWDTVNLVLTALKEKGIEVALLERH